MKDAFDNEIFQELKKELDKIGFTKKDMKEFEELEKELDNMDCDNW